MTIHASNPPFFYGFKRKRCIYYSFTRSDQPGCGTITRKGENKHLLLNASRLQCDMFAVLSSSDVWPIVIHFKRLACVALSLALLHKPSLALFLYLHWSQRSCKTDTLLSLTPSFLSPVSSPFLCFYFNTPLCLSSVAFLCHVYASFLQLASSMYWHL